MSRGAGMEGARAARGLEENLRAVARINLAAIERNVARMRRELRKGTRFCAVVKADGYGHGALAAARAALAGGADWLAVAGAQEAAQLRQAGVANVPLLVMGALSCSERGQALAAGADVVVWHERQVHEIAAAGGGRVHVKLDTGMGRLGTRDPAEATRVLEAAAAAEGVQAVGVMTHFATADERDGGGYFERQLDLFSSWVSETKERWPALIAHAANSAAMLREPASHFDMVRCGIGIYGLDPFGVDPEQAGLEPALELLSYVAEVKDCRSGQSAGYGRRFVAQRDTRLAVLPIGYGDGWRRGLAAGRAEVLIEGRRRPLVGTVSMDNVTVELGGDAASAAAADAGGSDGGPAARGPGGEVLPSVEVPSGVEVPPGAEAPPDADAPLGAEAVLIGARGEERITAEEVARRLQTINYEITCALTPRVLRVHHRDGQPAQ